MTARTRAIWISLAALAAVWLLAWGGYTLAAARKVTAEKVRAYVQSVDLQTLRGVEREQAIERLAAWLNALPFEERRRVRLEGLVSRWFDQMTEAERGRFLEATLPTGFKQMIAAFEELPVEKRRRAVQDALRRLREAQQNLPGGIRPTDGGPPPPVLSEQMQQQVVTIGLRAFYSQSSAQTKAELAPLLEELQRQLQSGRLFRQPRGP